MAKSNRNRKRLGSYPSSNVIFSITTALFMIGLFALFTINATQLTRKLREDIEVQILLSNHAAEQEKAEIRDQLTQRVYLDKFENELRIRFRTKEEWAEEMAQETGEDFVNFLGENPLRDAFLVHIRATYYTEEKMQEIKDDLEQLEGVFEVVYAEKLISQINTNIARIGLILSFFIAIFLVTVVVLIHNAIKLALFSQRFLIRSMQLVGATALFIKKPFLRRAWWQGFLSGAVASTVLLLLLVYSVQEIEELAILQNHWLNALILISLMLLGGLVSTGSAYFAINRYLRMKLEELY